ncbi:hybrid sensor histidine kinase/response regulator [[Archangium] primigenium]|uniref:hybrid sensor histidine kinase/response regulator n=1 Tax=Melittangium TaxID=44 RepID=UPI0019577030|nr:hybrid sensor histidine kinase/response regulator [Archangium primigenium]MBM7113816.1 response regulator [Archangium primigenium]
MSVDPMLQSLVAGFSSEAQEVCQKVTLDLLELEREGLDSEALGKVYTRLARHLHTLKGSAASLGLQDLSSIAHKLEDALAPLRKDIKPMSRPMVDMLLHGLDLFLLRAQAHADGRGDALPDPAVALAQLVADAPPPEEAAAMGGESAMVAPAPAAAPSVASSVASASFVQDEDADAGWRVASHQVTALMREVERLREFRMRLEDRLRDISKSVELLTARELLAPTARARAMLSAVTAGVRSDGHEASDIVDSLEEGLKSITTRPVRTILEPLQRMVRDLSRQLGKASRLSVVGAEVSLDRRLLEKLRGAMVHLLRNAVDHGIEMPDERERAGKHHEGALTLRVEQQGNILFLELSDDGRGVDAAQVRASAERKGLITTEEGARMHETQIRDLIFRPGFSTRTDVTDTSGRGVGLDAVRAAVESMQGRIEVVSTKGSGTRFIITIPMELGSSPVLTVRAIDVNVGLPMLAVESTQLATQENLRIGRTKTQLDYNGQLVPVSDLAARLGLRASAPPSEGQPLIIVQSGGKRMALAVDSVVGDRDLVIRPLPAEVRDVPSYQGAAILSRGELLLILRPGWVVTDATPQTVAMPQSRRALVVDDSLTARALHRAMLEAGGFTVHLAASGARALERLQTEEYDVIICDLEMEEMNGTEVIAKLRAQPDTRHLPVILVSANDSASARSRGLAAGADGYLSKRECAAGRLLSEVLDVMSRRGAHA